MKIRMTAKDKKLARGAVRKIESMRVIHEKQVRKYTAFIRERVMDGDAEAAALAALKLGMLFALGEML